MTQSGAAAAGEADSTLTEAAKPVVPAPGEADGAVTEVVAVAVVVLAEAAAALAVIPTVQSSDTPSVDSTTDPDHYTESDKNLLQIAKDHGDLDEDILDLFAGPWEDHLTVSQKFMTDMRRELRECNKNVVSVVESQTDVILKRIDALVEQKIVKHTEALLARIEKAVETLQCDTRKIGYLALQQLEHSLAAGTVMKEVSTILTKL